MRATIASRAAGTCCGHSNRAEFLQADLAKVGVHSLGAVASDELVRLALQKAPDVVLVDEVDPQPRTYEALAAPPAGPGRMGCQREPVCSTRS